MSDRAKRGKVIFENGGVYPQKGGVFLVNSQREKNGARYTVTFKAGVKVVIASNYAYHKSVTCGCADFKEKGGQGFCKHIHACLAFIRAKHEGLPIPRKPKKRFYAGITRRALPKDPARKKAQEHCYAVEGVELPERLRELCATAIPHKEREAGHPGFPMEIRTFCMGMKVQARKSGRVMKSIYERMVDDAMMECPKPPHRNSVLNFFSDTRMTRVLYDLFVKSGRPIWRIEKDFAVDGTGLSRASTEHYKQWREADEDKPYYKPHQKVQIMTGITTNVIVAARFSNSMGTGTNDINFLEPLITEAIERYDIQRLAADSGYHSAENILFAIEKGIDPYIPAKKGDLKLASADPRVRENLRRQYDSDPEFHEFYRMRNKIEGVNSAFKRLFDGFNWNRNDVQCINEALLKLILHNLRQLIILEHMHGDRIRFARGNAFFPQDDLALAS